MLQLFALGLLGFVLVRQKVVSSEGLNGLINFFITTAFPALILWEILSGFDPKACPYWWMFPLLSLAITAAGLLFGYLFSLRFRDGMLRREFISLSGFQNSGYLPLVLLKGILPPGELDQMLIYLFLFLLGFNLVIWSWGVYFLGARGSGRFHWGTLFSPPVIAVLAGLACVFSGIKGFIPEIALTTLGMVGKCSFPLAMIVVGGILAELLARAKFALAPNLSRLILVKLFLLPLSGLVLLYFIRPPYLIGLLIILELAVPSGVNLAIITKKHSNPERLISQGLFFTHIISLLTLPFFLAAFNFIVARR